MKTGKCVGRKSGTRCTDDAFAFGIWDEVLGHATTLTEWLVTAGARNHTVLGHGLVAIWLLTMKVGVLSAIGLRTTTSLIIRPSISQIIQLSTKLDTSR